MKGCEMLKKKGHRKEYSAPKLVVYGDMVKFTAGGTGAVNEASGMKP